MQPTEIALGTVNGGSDKLKLEYSYGDWVSTSIDATKNNGNIVQQVITVPDSPGEDDDFTATQKYYYDSLNRIDDAIETVDSTQTWRQDFSYDRYGNRSLVEANTTTIPKSCLEGETPVVCTADHKVYNPSANTSDNRLSSSDDYTYDAAGNTMIDAQQRRFIYDGENKQVEVSDQWSVVSGQYWYDGDGKRVKKVVPDTGEVTIFVYDAAGKQIAEYSTIVADTNDAKVAYLTNDHLGSPRINTDADGDITARHDYHPFGEEITTAERTAHDEYTPDSVRKQFTGQERDQETHLDYFYARHYGIDTGRFSSADDFGGKLSNPQSLNLYVYVMNRPLKWVDPTGHFVSDPEKDCGTDGEQCHTDENGELREADGDLYLLPGGPDMVVNVNGTGTPAGPSSYQENAPPPDLSQSVWDFVPVYGSLRRFAYNYNCNNGGGCNGGRAIGNLAMLAADLSPIGEAAWSWKLAQKAFVREVVEETGSIVADEAVKSGGRLGSTATRDQISEISSTLESRGYTITNGGQRGLAEECLRPLNGGRSGGSYVDITASHPTFGTLRINTVDVLTNGITPTARELRNAARIRSQIGSGEHLLLIPKKPGG